MINNKRHLDETICVFCAYTVSSRPRENTTRLLGNKDVTGTVETGHLMFVFDMALVTLNVPNLDQMLPTCQWLHMQCDAF